MSWIAIFFRKKHPEPLTTSPRPGEKWRLKQEETPWPRKADFIVYVLEVRDEWVRYDMGGMFCDERMKLSSFVYSYERIS
jgi:hypothetical protein